MMCTNVQQAAGLQQSLDQELRHSQLRTSRQAERKLLAACRPQQPRAWPRGNTAEGGASHTPFKSFAHLHQQPAQGSADGDTLNTSGKLGTHCLQESMIICLTWGWFPLMELPQPL